MAGACCSSSSSSSSSSGNYAVSSFHRSRLALIFFFLGQSILLLQLGLLSLPVEANSDLVNIMVPAYFDPSSSPQAWASLNSAASSLPNRVVAVANPSNGPGSAAQQSYAAAIQALQNNTGRAIGYVYTSSTQRSLASVEADVDKWYSFYPGINGIFFDEVTNSDDGKQAYYQTLYKYVKSKNANSLVVNNPGTTTLESYLFYNGSRVADVICTFEQGVGALEWMQASWTSTYDRSNFYGLFYNVTDVNVSSFDYGDVIDRAYQQNAGWVYVTDDSLPNPWDTIATYFSGEVSFIANYNYL